MLVRLSGIHLNQNGTPRKLLNVDKIHKLGWKHKIGLREGIVSTYKWYMENEA